MRRQDIHLLVRVRHGDAEARCEVGRRYLLGAEGFPRHFVTGLDYLTHPSVACSEQASCVIAEALPLHEIVRLNQLPALRSAARVGSPGACVKLGLWLCLTRRDAVEAEPWLRVAAEAGHAAAPAAVAHLAANLPPRVTSQRVLHALAGHAGIDALALLTQAAYEALRGTDVELLSRALDALLALCPRMTTELADCVCQGLEHGQAMAGFWLEAPSTAVEQVLESCLQRGRTAAALLLGRAYCGIDHGALRAAALVPGQNMRKGAALLLRAADAGEQEAWMHLYRVHSDNHSSVANPQMARFFLEKAAVGGDVVARRWLGALTLRGAGALHESERGIHWLHEAAASGDTHAARLLRSLVLPVAGNEEDAALVIDAIRRDDPWIAWRLRVARDFGLTKLEALSVDLVAGRRAWGLVVGANPFITQAKLSAPRAVPALTAQAGEHLRRGAAFFEQARQDGAPFEGDLRRRSVRMRQLLGRHGGHEEMFFAEATSSTLHSLRLGTKWAFHARQPLRMALAA
ncbi:MAG: hypothetical protein KIT17_01335 [Rubrivivax sp.]|nr:hypothetical protein [Rubrivivax sp.]